MKILIIEDDSSLREIITRGLLDEGYIVESAANYSDANDKIAGYSYDCILLDIMLPDGNGLRLLEHIKSLKKRDHVIIISARDSIDDKVTGLDLGADDYLAKPFYMAELSARIKSVLHRSVGADGNKLNAGNLTLDLTGRSVEVDGKPLALLKKEYDILLYFLQRPNHLVSKSMLAEAIWGDHFDDVDNYDFVYAQIKNLRKRLSTWNANIELSSVYGMGYKLILND